MSPGHSEHLRRGSIASVRGHTQAVASTIMRLTSLRVAVPGQAPRPSIRHGHSSCSVRDTLPHHHAMRRTVDARRGPLVTHHQPSDPDPSPAPGCAPQGRDGGDVQGLLQGLPCDLHRGPLRSGRQRPHHQVHRRGRLPGACGRAAPATPWHCRWGRCCYCCCCCSSSLDAALHLLPHGCKAPYAAGEAGGREAC